MTTTSQLVDLVFAQLTAAGATDAADRVYRVGDWPTQSDQYPIQKLRVTRETKQSLGRGGGPGFTVTATIRIIGEVSAPVEVDDAGAAAAEAALWRLQRQNEVAVIGSYALERKIQQILSVDSQLAYTSDAATHLAGIQTDLTVEFYQGPEDFAPVEADDLTEVEAELTNQPPHGFSLTLPQ